MRAYSRVVNTKSKGINTVCTSSHKDERQRETDRETETYSGAKKVFSQPPIVQVLPLKKMTEACTFHHRNTSTMTDKIRKKIQKITL